MNPLDFLASWLHGFRLSTVPGGWTVTGTLASGRPLYVERSTHSAALEAAHDLVQVDTGTPLDLKRWSVEHACILAGATLTEDIARGRRRMTVEGARTWHPSRAAALREVARLMAAHPADAYTSGDMLLPGHHERGYGDEIHVIPPGSRVAPRNLTWAVVQGRHGWAWHRWSGEFGERIRAVRGGA